MDRSDVEVAATVLLPILVTLAEPAGPGLPIDAPLHHPPLGVDDETVLVGHSLRDSNDPTALALAH